MAPEGASCSGDVLNSLLVCCVGYRGVVSECVSTTQVDVGVHFAKVTEASVSASEAGYVCMLRLRLFLWLYADRVSKCY